MLCTYTIFSIFIVNSMNLKDFYLFYRLPLSIHDIAMHFILIFYQSLMIYGEISLRQNIRAASFLTAKSLTINCPTANLFTANCPVSVTDSPVWDSFKPVLLRRRLRR